jgi:hypothetical protein
MRAINGIAAMNYRLIRMIFPFRPMGYRYRIPPPIQRRPYDGRRQTVA